MAVTVSSLLRSSSTGPITVTQFADVLQRTWTESRRFRPGTAAVLPKRLGLAVSGGADSMALAYLCREWEKQQQRNNPNGNPTHRANGDGLRVTAFIVDHKARPESATEAKTVSAWLQALGLQTSILPLTWPSSSLTSSAFETHARRLRYRALGEACRERGIEALLMGHHQDDNVETTIWRLASGAKGAAGLTGIPRLARIPECHGLWGVAESGDSVSVSPGDFVPDLTPGQGQGQHQHQQEENRIQVATGGIHIARPLLSFRKSSLVATCVENGVSFVDDPTNFDPTLTPRNAIRSMLSKGSLPRALTNPSILSLIERSQGRVRESYRHSDETLAKSCRLLDVNLRVGAMAVQFLLSHSDLKASSRGQGGQENQDQEQKQKNTSQPLAEIQALTLRRITELISPFPENHWPLSSFAEFTDRVFLPTPGSESHSTSGSESNARRKAFTVGAVLFQPLASSPKSKSKTAANTTLTENATNKWLLTRQPYFRNRAPTLRLNLPISRRTKVNGIPIYTPWILWDNRFWIRAAAIPIPDPNLQSAPISTANHGQETEIPIAIRPLQQSDLSLVRRIDAVQKRARKERILRQDGISVSRVLEDKQDNAETDAPAFLAKLSSQAPGQARFTLPVLALDQGEGGGCTPLALPTLDLLFPDFPNSGPSSKSWTIGWEWKYKMVDLDSLKLMGLV
ncbi:PP-loop family-domain-containing protein [Aspergillus insuetus]